MSIKIFGKYGKRTQHGIPLEKLRILGRSGGSELRSWMKEWLKIKR
jgi:hypothetical protein